MERFPSHRASKRNSRTLKGRVVAHVAIVLLCAALLALSVLALALMSGGRANTLPPPRTLWLYIEKDESLYVVTKGDRVFATDEQARAAPGYVGEIKVSARRLTGRFLETRRFEVQTVESVPMPAEKRSALLEALTQKLNRTSYLNQLFGEAGVRAAVHSGAYETSRITPIIFIWSIAFVIGLVATWNALILFRLWPWLEFTPPLCRRCGYDLTGITCVKCPECAHPVG